MIIISKSHAMHQVQIILSQSAADHQCYKHLTENKYDNLQIKKRAILSKKLVETTAHVNMFFPM